MKKINEIWGIPFYSKIIDNKNQINNDLKNIILKKEIKYYDTIKPNEIVGIKDGLSSRWYAYNLLAWENNSCSYLYSFIKKCYLDYIKILGHEKKETLIQCWANVLRKNEKVKIHSHEGAYSYISGVYWVDAQDTSTYYRCPLDSRINGVEDFFTDHREKNTQGKLVMFPSFIEHFTTEYKGDDERISIAFDITISPPKKYFNTFNEKVFLDFHK